jgi:hypothetical protein
MRRFRNVLHPARRRTAPTALSQRASGILSTEMPAAILDDCGGGFGGVINQPTLQRLLAAL